MDLRDVTEFLRDSFKYFLAVIAIILIFTFVVAFQPIAGNSMYPTLEEGEIVLVSKFQYTFSKVKRNEIVVVHDDNGKSFTKRIIGLPGEKVEYLNGFLYIDGEAMDETYLGDDVMTSNFLFEDICSIDGCKDGVIPKGYYLVLGDNRPQSEDSRTPSFGLRHIDDIKGKVIFRIWPLNKLGGVK